MTTQSDAREGQDEGQRQEAMPSSPPMGGSNAQTRRTHAHAREAEHTTPGATDGDERRVRETPAWVSNTARYISRQGFLKHSPTGASELWRRIQNRAADSEGWLPTVLIYVGGAAGCAATWIVLAIAQMWQLAFCTGRPRALEDLLDHAAEVIGRQDDRGTVLALRVGYGLAWAMVAACYAVVYVIQFPALLALLAFCSGVAFLTSLF